MEATMRKAVKNNLLEIFKTIYEAHEVVKGFIDKKEYENAQNLLADCQDTAIQLGNLIEESEGEGFVTVSFLEEYCEALYEAATNLSEESNAHKVQKQLDKKIIKAENSVKNDINVKLEIVFMPYKASMWDSLESVWKAADEDPDCDAYVVPIPYYDRNPDHSFGEFHYEGGDYPDYVPVVHYEAYNLEQRRPDVIYIHNPYDGNNLVTSVDPRFYSNQLKKYTDKLVYIPYFVVASPNIRFNILGTPVCINSDNIILQSEGIKASALEVFRKSGYPDTHNIGKKIVALGSPKLDSAINAKRENFDIPESWKQILQNKKVVLYNTSISSALEGKAAFLEMIENTLQEFKESNDFVLWWRPHPLLEATYEAMNKSLCGRYRQILTSYKQQGFGILDQSNQLQRALAYCDIYYGDRKSSFCTLFCATGKPLVYIDTDIVGYTSDFKRDYNMTYRDNSNYDVLNRNANCDGTSGKKIHQYIKGKFFK